MILILCGKSGSGKDAILKKLVERGFTPIVSTTSRPIRSGETDGVEYNFVSREKFEKLIEYNELIEYRTYDTLVGGVPDVWYYGIVKTTLDEREKYVVILDVKGTTEFVRHFGKDSCYVAYITAPDDIRTERAMSRGSFDQYEWDRRMKADCIDFNNDAVSSVANIVIDNSGDLDECVDEVEDYFFLYRINSCL